MKHTRKLATTLSIALASWVLGVAMPATSQESAQALAGRIAAEGNGKGAAGCSSCHGAQGQGQAAAGFPRLAGLEASYIKAQLELFQQETRKNPVMVPMAKPLSAEEINALAAYYAAMPAAADPTGPKPDAEELRRGESLVRYGRWSDDVPACVSCHGKQLNGLSTTFPSLVGQPAAYLRSTLTQWRTGDRKGDPNDLMGSVARRLTDRDIADAAAYLSSLPLPTKPANTADAPAAEVKP